MISRANIIKQSMMHQNDDAKGKIQFYHETLEDTTLRLYNIETFKTQFKNACII